MSYRINGTLYPSKEYYDAVQKVKAAGLTQTTENVKKAMAGDLDTAKSETTSKEDNVKSVQDQIITTKDKIKSLQDELAAKSAGNNNLDDVYGFSDLQPDEQQYVTDYYNILKTNDTERQALLKQALIDAQESADPYFAAKIRMSLDELLRATGEVADDFASNQETIQNNIDRINQDLIEGKGRISIDEQAELKRQQRKYEYELEGLVENARHAGLTFSSKRALAENRLGIEQADIVESTKRGFQRQLDDLIKLADRGDEDARNQLEDYKRMYGEDITKLGRAAESYLGSSAIPGMEGYKPMGGVVGTIKEDELKDIKARAGQLYDTNSPFF